MSDLKACPFCGFEYCGFGNPGNQDELIWCPECFTDGPLADTKDEAVALWNTRANPWIKFDDNDESTWPNQGKLCVILTANANTQMGKFLGDEFKTGMYKSLKSAIYYMSIPEVPEVSQC